MWSPPPTTTTNNLCNTVEKRMVSIGWRPADRVFGPKHNKIIGTLADRRSLVTHQPSVAIAAVGVTGFTTVKRNPTMRHSFACYADCSDTNKKLCYRGEHSASDFSTNWKLICDFLLVINTNLSCTISKLWLIIIGQIFASDRGVLITLTLSLRMTP